MLNEIGYSIPINLRQMENASIIKNNTATKLEQTPGKVLESFGRILQKQIDETSAMQKDANKAQEIFATGGNISLHEVMIKAEKAEMAMQLTLQLRNKLLMAYKEIQNMQV
ncbi:MAG: flagellar hook-basal body complex protein FliE [Cyanobacteriota bacterium]